MLSSGLPFGIHPGALSTGTHLGVIAFPQETVSLLSSPPGIPLDISGINQPTGFGWNGANQDLVMTAVTSIPEPGTLALAGLGVAALLIFRRRK